MDEFRLKTDHELDAGRRSLERLLENIRVTSLNMAISAAKLKIGTDSREIVRRSISELVNLSLDTVNHVARIIKALNSGTDLQETEAEQHLSELKQIEETVSRRSEEVIRLLSNTELDG